MKVKEAEAETEAIIPRNMIAALSDKLQNFMHSRSTNAKIKLLERLIAVVQRKLHEVRLLSKLSVTIQLYRS